MGSWGRMTQSRDKLCFTFSSKSILSAARLSELSWNSSSSAVGSFSEGLGRKGSRSRIAAGLARKFAASRWRFRSCKQKKKQFVAVEHNDVSIVIFLIHFGRGNFAATRDGLGSRGAARHRVSPNHPEFQQNYPRGVIEWGNELFSCLKNLVCGNLRQNEEKLHFLIQQQLVVNLAETQDGLDTLGALRHLVSPNHPSLQQNYHSQNEWGK